MTAAVAALIALSSGSPQRRSLALGAATGIVFGATSAITERTSHRLGISVGHALDDWSPYVLIAVSIGGLVLNQSAFQAGDLKWSLPAITVLEPLVAILIGQTLFHEHVETGALHVTGQILGLASMVVGVLMLATSPALSHLAPARDGPEPGRPVVARAELTPCRSRPVTPCAWPSPRRARGRLRGSGRAGSRARPWPSRRSAARRR